MTRQERHEKVATKLLDSGWTEIYSLVTRLPESEIEYFLGEDDSCSCHEHKKVVECEHEWQNYSNGTRLCVRCLEEHL